MIKVVQGLLFGMAMASCAAWAQERCAESISDDVSSRREITSALDCQRSLAEALRRELRERYGASAEASKCDATLDFKRHKVSDAQEKLACLVGEARQLRRHISELRDQRNAEAQKQRQREEEAKRQARKTESVKTFKDCPDCPEMVIVPPGSFDMGSPTFESSRDSDEGPVHRVTVPFFALARTHVTRGQYAAFLNATGYQGGNACYTLVGSTMEERLGKTWRDFPEFRQDDSHPAVCLSWYDAKAYVEWLSKKTGKAYRLPSEAEMEYAIRGGSTSARWWGDNPDLACGNANVGDQTLKSQKLGVIWDVHNCADGFAYTAPVASFKPNGFGLYDMIGNAWQWVEDCYHENYAGAPTNGSPWTSGECNQRVRRGGTWYFDPRNTRSATRSGYTPTYRSSGTGFRPARMLP